VVSGQRGGCDRVRVGKFSLWRASLSLDSRAERPFRRLRTCWAPMNPLKVSTYYSPLRPQQRVRTRGQVSTVLLSHVLCVCGPVAAWRLCVPNTRVRDSACCERSCLLECQEHNPQSCRLICHAEYGGYMDLPVCEQERVTHEPSARCLPAMPSPQFSRAVQVMARSAAPWQRNSARRT
jgi:hypothetical protein